MRDNDYYEGLEPPLTPARLKALQLADEQEWRAVEKLTPDIEKHSSKLSTCNFWWRKGIFERREVGAEHKKAFEFRRLCSVERAIELSIGYLP